jgi:hypothetical protein
MKRTRLALALLICAGIAACDSGGTEPATQPSGPSMDCTPGLGGGGGGVDTTGACPQSGNPPADSI